METLIARSYARLIKAGRKAIEDVPPNVVPYLRELAPELFAAEDGHES